MLKVAKFGGSSLADASRISNAMRIIRNDPDIRLVVVSAPGKRNPEDDKVTDLLYDLCRFKNGVRTKSGMNGGNIMVEISGRFHAIINELCLSASLSTQIDAVLNEIEKEKNLTEDFVASRGEYMTAMIMAEILCFHFLDAASFIRFDRHGRYDCAKTMSRWVEEDDFPPRQMVIPGFYGATPDGKINTFSRGGSDITGAIVAKLARADVYENWTDVPGVLRADPKIVDNPKTIDILTYRELRELSYMGANVLHEEAVFPVREAGIPIHVRNTNKPADKGTMIVPNYSAPKRPAGSIVGIAGRKHFTVLTVEKPMMNQEIGFVRKICSVMEDQGVSFEQIPGGIDNMSVVIGDKELGGNLNEVCNGIRNACQPETFRSQEGISMICVVSEDMAYTHGVAAKIFTAVAEAGVNVRLIAQGSSEISILFGVKDNDCEKAIRSVYRAFS